MTGMTDKPAPSNLPDRLERRPLYDCTTPQGASVASDNVTAIYVPMPLNAAGDGPADPDETAKIEHQVWDAETNGTLCVAFDEAVARHIAACLNLAAAPAPSPDGTVQCSCGRRYEKGPDLVVPDDVWEKISPTGDEGGILCPNCINDALEAAGFGYATVPASFTSGPMANPNWRKPSPDAGAVAWLIELQSDTGAPAWLKPDRHTGRQGPRTKPAVTWTTDANCALQFKSKAEAEGFVWAKRPALNHATITEHMFIGPDKSDAGIVGELVTGGPEPTSDASNLAEALTWVLPLAKGYAAGRDVAANQRIIQNAEEILARVSGEDK